MDKIQAGMMAISKAGRDRGKLYMIINLDDSYVYLADGRLRSLERLKKKKIKHIQLIKKIPENISEAIKSGEINDLMIKDAIKAYSNRFE